MQNVVAELLEILFGWLPKIYNKQPYLYYVLKLRSNIRHLKQELAPVI
jgi:hypothetical protein